jgi:Protein of unknown function (DUF3738)
MRSFGTPPQSLARQFVSPEDAFIAKKRNMGSIAIVLDQSRHHTTTTKVATLAGILLGLVQLLSGQQSTALTFEVASVKRNNMSESGRQGALFQENINTTQGGVTLRNVTLNSCIKFAFVLQDPQISGPDWITIERYDIVAKSSGPTSEEHLRLMLKALLSERFKLVVHSETRSLSVIALAVGKG